LGMRLTDQPRPSRSVPELNSHSESFDLNSGVTSLQSIPLKKSG